ncbi:MAG: TetR/AcrR family transcriptional regulator [Haloechinothrix sp.]
MTSGAPPAKAPTGIEKIRRLQVVQAVRRIIVRDGLRAATIANIAREARVSPGVVTYHFENKEAVLREVLRAAMRDAKQQEPMSIADLTLRVSELSGAGSDWWTIHFAFLAEARSNTAYRRSLAWSDQRYREALGTPAGSEARGAVILALMQGLAMQLAVEPNLQLSEVAAEIRDLLSHWERCEASDGR